MHATKIAVIATVLVVLTAAQTVTANSAFPWMDTQADPESRAKLLLAQMTLDEKIMMVHGSAGPYVGNVPGNARLQIPALNLNDGPQGFRDDAHPGTSTCWPSGLTVAATWNTSAADAWGTAMGKEFYGKGANIQLGPGMCLARVPVNGRNFEYASGEDPYLGYTLIQPIIKGIQSQGVMANAKHYVNNNQETNRGAVSENVDERTRFEMYYPPFEGAIEAGVGSFMCSYNKINDVYSCENNDTLATDLKARMGNGQRFFVMSDWGATHSTSIQQGLDQEMPGSNFMGDSLKQMILNGKIANTTLDNTMLNILTPMFAVGIFDSNNTNSISNNVTSDAHNMLARQISAESHVLLKNDNNVLPLTSTVKTIAVIGAQASTKVTVHGGGSGSVQPPYVITPLQGIYNRLSINSAPVASACNAENVCVLYDDGSNTTTSAKVASMADVALVFVATSSSEGSDRANLQFGGGQDDLVTVVAANQRNTVVVGTTPGAVLLPWSEDVSAILINFMPGQELGNAVADVLFGDVNPSGRLPLTFPNVENEVGFTTRQYPGLNNAAQAYYDEGLFVGYRWYTQHGVTPKYPFGHGLSYTTFEFSGLTASQASVQFTVKNTGSVSGAVVPQLYLEFPASANEPPMQLKGFTKVELSAGDQTQVTLNLKDRDFSIWDVSTHSWLKQSGTYTAHVGMSVLDIKLTATISI
eukprot:m.13209 g.13209  ORF g.13209 m.13209 type:complete len:698 (+) comp5915_c1_seq1:277-2370(+)